MTAAGVDQATQDSLIAKLRAGVLWDSQNGSQPVSTVHTVSNGNNVETQTFADGSEIINTTQIPVKRSTGSVTPMSIDSCSYGSGAGNFPFYGCHVATSQFLFSIDFYVDGMISDIGDAQVSNWRNMGYWTAGATVNYTSWNLIRRTQSGSSDAAIQAVLHVTFLGGSGSGVDQLTFHVRDTSMWDTSP